MKSIKSLTAFFILIKKELTKMSTMCYNRINRLFEKCEIYPYYLTSIIIQSNVEMSSPF